MDAIMLPLLTCLFIAFDSVSGNIAAVANHIWKSSIMRKGLYHKFGSIILVALAYLIDYAQKFVDLGFQVPIAAGVCVYIILMELGSIIENIGKINPDLLPAQIRKIIGLGGKEHEED